MSYHNPNLANQNLDIAGSENINSNKTLSDEVSGLGQFISAGSGAILFSFSNPTVTIIGLSGFTSDCIGKFITISGAANVANNGTFPIINFISPTSIQYTNSNAVIPDGNLVNWIQRSSYSLEDDINFIRTDREAIKGVSFFSAIPTYQRPTNTSTDVPANLLNIAGKTTDARGFIINKIFYNSFININDTKLILNSIGNLKHSDSIDKTGVPCFDVAPYLGNFLSCYVELLDGYTDGEILVLSGVHAGEKIFGVTNGGTSTSPNSVEVIFYSCPIGSDINTNSTLYTWETNQVNKITCIYGFFQRLDLLPDDAFRRSLSGGGGGSTQASPQLLNSFLFGGM